MRAAFVSIVSHPRAAQINSVRCCAAMLTHSGDTLVKIHRWWKTIRGNRVRKPHITHVPAVPAVTAPPPRCCDERRERTSTSRLLCLFTFRITPCSFWTMFQCVLLCFLSNRISMRVVSRYVWLTHAHICACTLPFNFPPCARGPLCPSPHL